MQAEIEAETRTGPAASNRVAFAIPGDLSARTGGYGYDRRILSLLPGEGLRVSHIALPGGFPNPSADELTKTARSLQAVMPGTLLLIDGLAFGVLPEALLASLANPLIALTHHPLGLETGLSQAESSRLLAAERRALSHARHCIVTSPMTARLVAGELGYPISRITVAEPGTDAAPQAHGSGGGPLTMFAAGSIIPRKGYDVLMNALGHLRDLEWRLVLAGSANRAPETAQALREQIARLGLQPRVTLLGDLDEAELHTAFGRADIFVMSSHFEGYGMVLAEAMARGLPIVTTRGGAAAETVPDGAALKTPPGDAPALAAALRRMITDARLRQACAEAAWDAGQVLPRWSDAAAAIATALRHVAEDEAAAR